MSRRTLILVGGASALVAGLALAYVTVRNVALTAELFESSRPMSGSRPPLVVSILQIISLPAIPLGILVALIGLLIFLGTSSVARWGVALAAWGKILPAIAVAAVLSSAAPFALAAVGMAGGTMLADLSQLATGFLWVALGVALWRYAPEHQSVGTTPLTS